jgi:hypothetical protein
MADGAVRFIPDNIPDDVFKAMCTIKGAEKVDLNKYTTLIPPPAEKDELETTAEAPPAPPKVEKKEAPKKEPAKKDYQGWTEYAPPEGGFEVRFPTEPTVRAASPATGNFHIADSKGQDLEFKCQWIIKDQPYANKQAEIVYLRSQQAGMLTASKGQLIDEEEITLHGSNGREFTIEIPNKQVVRCRSYLAGKRMISVQVWGKDAEAVRSTEAEKFLDSLKISN